eukprot:scaffold18223_cov60-Phaeocystis_antarctica.AAC.1
MAELGGCRFMGRCAWAGWRGVAYTNVDTARRMRGSFSASHERFGGPCTGPRPIRGLLSMNKLSTKQGHSWAKQPGSRVFPSGASIDSLRTYQAMVYRGACTPGGGAPDQRQRLGHKS